ncbi:MAG: alpha/beta fold hydrolase [Silicimonas sp.]|nr:alpha/beta fold hydrolase [Silicimonas sp.]
MTPLVLVHGFLGGAAQWGDLTADVAVDLPGFGARAEEPPLNRIEDMAAWVLAQISAERFHLLGHSMGGMIVQEMVHQAPHRIEKLVLYATGARGVLPGRFEPIEVSMTRARKDGAEATARRIAATWFLHGEAARAYPATADIAAGARLPALIAGLEAMRDWSGEDRLAAITQETLVLWGDGDRTYPWSQIETLWKTIPDSHLAVLPQAAHAVHLERPALFNRMLRDFLTGADHPDRPGG